MVGLMAAALGKAFERSCGTRGKYPRVSPVSRTFVGVSPLAVPFADTCAVSPGLFDLTTCSVWLQVWASVGEGFPVLDEAVTKESVVSILSCPATTWRGWPLYAIPKRDEINERGSLPEYESFYPLLKTLLEILLIRCSS